MLKANDKVEVIGSNENTEKAWKMNPQNEMGKETKSNLLYKAWARASRRVCCGYMS